MVKRKNICITINSLDRGGAEKQALLLAKALKPYHNPVLVILNPQPIYVPRLEIIEREEILHIYLSKNPLKKIVGFISFLKKRNIDIIFSFLPLDTMFSGLCGKIAGVPYVFGGIRNSHIAWIKFTGLKIVHNFLLNYTIANNYSAFHSSIEFGFKKSVFVVPNGIEIRPVLKNQNLERKTIIIVSVGRLVKQKDYYTALESINLLKQHLNNEYQIKYRIVGNGPELTNIETCIKKFDLLEEVELIVNPVDVYDLLESADIYLCTSTYEGISNSIMEAMNCAMPIVATNAGDNSRLVVHQKNGFITDLKDYPNLARYMRLLIEYPTKRKEMGLESYSHLVNCYGYKAFQNKYLKIIQNVDRIEIFDGDLQSIKDNSIST